MSAQRPLTVEGESWQPDWQATGRSVSGRRVPGAAPKARPVPTSDQGRGDWPFGVRHSLTLDRLTAGPGSHT
jgi:hypothetical protein